MPKLKKMVHWFNSRWAKRIN